MKNIFFGIVDEKNKFVFYTEFSSGGTEYVVLDVAPSSATFFNCEYDAINVAMFLEREYPEKEFTIKRFEY